MERFGEQRDPDAAARARLRRRSGRAVKTFALLQIADAVTTLVFLRLGVPEGNGMVARLMADIGIVPALILTKVVITVLAAWLLGARTQNWANIAFGFVVIWNLCAIWLVGAR